MSNDPNKLSLSVELEIQQAIKDVQKFTDKLEENRKIFERLKNFETPFDGIEKKMPRASVGIEKFSKAMSESANKIEFVTKELQAFEKQRDKLLGTIGSKELLGKDIQKEVQDLANLSASYNNFMSVVKQSGVLEKESEQILTQKIDSMIRLNSLQKDLVWAKEQDKKLAEEAAKAERERIQAQSSQNMFRNALGGLTSTSGKSAQDSAGVLANAFPDSSRKALKDFELSLDPIAQKMAFVQQKLNEARTSFMDSFTAKDMGGIQSAKKDIKKLSKELEKLENSTKKSSKSWRVLLGRIKNIAIYRTIRTALHWLTSGIQEGVDNLVQYDKTANDTMSNINASVMQIKNTMGIAFMSVLQALEPVITSLASSLVDLINSFNLAMAKMSGENVYTKAKKSVDDYAKSLQKAKKFSFDAFEVLSGNEAGKTPANEMFEEGKVEEDANSWSKLFENVLTIVKGIADVIKEVWNTLADSGALQVIVEVFGEIFNMIGSILKVVAKFIAGLNEIGLLKPLLLGIAAAFVVIKGAAIAAAIASAAQTIMSNPWIGIPAVLAGVGMLATIGGKLLATSSVEGFAEGGFTNANLIATNENGKREWIGRNANATAVVNDTQMSQVMYQAVSKGSYEGMVRAIYETGMADAYSSKLVIDANGINDSAFARAIFPALKVESTRMGGNQL